MSDIISEAITIYGLMFGTPVDCTLGEIDQLFRSRSSHELMFEAAFGLTVGTAFDRAFGTDDPRTLAIAATAFGPVALELDSRGLSFPHDEEDRLPAFESWKRAMATRDAYVQTIPTHRLVNMRTSIEEAISRIGPWGTPTLSGSLLQVMIVVDLVLEQREVEPITSQLESSTLLPSSNTPQSSDDNSIAKVGVQSDPPSSPFAFRPDLALSNLTNDASHDTDSGSGRSASIFIAYAHKDARYRNSLEKHLSPLRRRGKISHWYDGKILPGQLWETKINEQLEQADLIVLLISADFIHSEYCYSVELQRALERHREGSAIVVPIVVRPVHWHGEPFAELQMLPANAKAVSTWKLQDNAWVSVVSGIQRAIASIEK